MLQCSRCRGLVEGGKSGIQIFMQISANLKSYDELIEVLLLFRRQQWNIHFRHAKVPISKKSRTLRNEDDCVTRVWKKRFFKISKKYGSAHRSLVFIISSSSVETKVDRLSVSFAKSRCPFQTGDDDVSLSILPAPL
ncbi:hypothetical protein D918_01018 [Trichuris suis]|nr:hypothetical protein D918_01018 [Trichuris suis]